MRRTGWGAWLLLSCLTIIGCNGGANQPAPTKPPEVLVSLPVSKEVTEFEDFTGHTEAVATVTIRARVTGYLDKVNFKEGTEVTKGDVLFEIDPRPYEAQLDQGKADLVNKKAVAMKAEAVWRRSEVLLRSRASTQEEIDTQKGDYEVAKAAIGQAEAKLRESQLNLNWTKVTSPISGRISRQMIDPGNLVTADQTPLTTIVSLDPMYVYYDVDERTVLRLRRLIQDGKIKSSREVEIPVLIGLADEEGFSIQGTINFVDNKLDASTGTLRVRGIFPNPKRILSPGMFVRVRIVVGTAYKAILVSEQALGTDQGQKFLYVVNDKNEIVYRRVKVGPLNSGMRVIQSGLTTGERVVVSGLQRVRPGTKVEPKTIEMPMAAGAAQLPLLTATNANGTAKGASGSP